MGQLVTPLAPHAHSPAVSGADARPASQPDPSALVRALIQSLGDGRTRDVDASTRRRAEYTTDASNYRVVPQAVVFPRTAEDVVAVMGVCARLGVPVTARGGGTSVAGNAIGPGVVLDLSRHLHKILSIDVTSRTAVLEPGTVLDDLQGAARPHGLRFGPDPSTHSRCTLGGMIGNDACGSHALAYGRTSDNVLALQVVDAQGRCWWTDDPPADVRAGLTEVAAAHLATIRTRFGTFGRQVSGYALQHLLPEQGGVAGSGGSNLARLLCGSEGTLGIVTAARVRLVPEPAAVAFVVLGYPDMAAAADATLPVLTHDPLAVEGLDRRLVEAVRARGGATLGLPAGDGWLFVEVGGEDAAAAQAAAHALVRDPQVQSAALDALIVPTQEEAKALWRIREDGAGYAGRTVDNQPAWPGWEDTAVPPAHLGAYLRELATLMRQHQLDGLAYGHFGDGCVHLRIDFPLAQPEGAAATETFLRAATQLVARHGGSLSGEHGDGRARSALLPLIYDADALAAFEQVKAVFDPAGLLNPGVLVRPAPLTADLRVPAARPASALSRRGLQLTYPDDEDDLTAAVHRCVGVGKCRADSSAVMCPSYLATGDEKDSTRGRARLLQEMTNGTLVTTGWRSNEVLDSLDLCLGCKGCAVDCPAGVDMATYKIEFLDHHFRGRLRPAAHYVLGGLPRWARIAALAPGLVNALTGVPALAAAAKRAGGIDPRRPLPRFADQTFRAWFTQRQAAQQHTEPPELEPVVLWVDTFTDAFDPQIGRAAVTVLEHLGFEVHLPTRKVCCGLTWLSTGQLGAAKRHLARTLDALDGPAGRDGVPSLRGMPVVGLEPSCTALLRDDTARLLPDDPRAHDLPTRVRSVAEFIAERRPDWTPPQLGGAAVVQQHCHQHAAWGFQADQALLAAAGVTPQVLPGCCGLAGNFGAETGHYDVSVAVAEQHLLPALRAHDGATPLLADGFSCRTQASDLAGRRGLHLVQLLEAGLTVQAAKSRTQ